MNDEIYLFGYHASQAKAWLATSTDFATRTATLCPVRFAHR